MHEWVNKWKRKHTKFNKQQNIPLESEQMLLDWGVGMVIIILWTVIMFVFDSVWDGIKYRDHKLFFSKKKKMSSLISVSIPWYIDIQSQIDFIFLDFACEDSV